MHSGAGRSAGRALAVAMCLGVMPARADETRVQLPTVGPGLGRAISQSYAAEAELNVRPDGELLPRGRGSVADGRVVFADKCQFCHGAAGVGGVGGIPRLTGGVGSLATERPLKTVNSFWPYAPSVFDYVRRAMPPTSPQSLSANELYAVIAYILSVDAIVAPDATLDARSLEKVAMPNRDGFVSAWPKTTTP